MTRKRLTKKKDSAKKATLRLLNSLGSRKVITQGNAKYMGSFDSSKLAFDYDALLRARSENDVSVCLKLANEYGVPVTTRGAGTSLTGSASPAGGGWVLDVTLMNRIAIKKDKAMAIVQPGAIVSSIQAAAEAEGLFYPPDPSSQKYCTIGGNIACNAGGMRCAKYGVTRDYVLALEGFLPNGEKVSWGGEYRKYATGYNIRDLWIGSEGTLGVVTKAVLKLLPKPEKTWTLVAAFDSDEDALRAVQRLLEEGFHPSILEFLDKRTIYCAEEIAGVRLFKNVSGKPLLLVEFDGPKAALTKLKPKVLNWAKRTSRAYKQAKNDREAEMLWETRRKCSGAMFALGDTKINEDIVVPLENQVRFAKFLDTLVRRSRLPIATFGHAADGNFHVNIMYHRDNDDEMARAKWAVKELMQKIVGLKGTISGEHGIGLAKTPFMKIARNEAEMDAMRAIKKALDPNNILNPGKIFDVYEVWNHTPETVSLPWDKKRPEGRRILPEHLF